MILSNDKPIDALRIDEKTHVENPLLEQLEKQGWKVFRLEQKQTPKDSFRKSFAEVILLPRLEEALRKINPFLGDDQIADVVRKITSFPQRNLIENNRQVLQYLLENTTVSINNDTGEPSPTVRYVDFENRKNNSFIAISQFKVSVSGTEHHIIPDVVLFLNGLPIAVIECKSPKVKEPIPEAIDQMLRYSQQRGDSPEGNAELFYYNQFLLATCRQQAKFGTITTHIEKHFFRWTDPYPVLFATLLS